MGACCCIGHIALSSGECAIESSLNNSTKHRPHHILCPITENKLRHQMHEGVMKGTETDPKANN